MVEVLHQVSAEHFLLQVAVPGRSEGEGDLALLQSSVRVGEAGLVLVVVRRLLTGLPDSLTAALEQNSLVLPVDGEVPLVAVVVSADLQQARELSMSR